VVKKWVEFAAACVCVIVFTLLLVIGGSSLSDYGKTVTPEGVALRPYEILGIFLVVIGIGCGLVGLMSVADMLDGMSTKKVTPNIRRESSTRKRSAV